MTSTDQTSVGRQESPEGAVAAPDLDVEISEDVFFTLVFLNIKIKSPIKEFFGNFALKFKDSEFKVTRSKETLGTFPLQ
jgi:hypothetical protein